MNLAAANLSLPISAEALSSSTTLAIIAQLCRCRFRSLEVGCKHPHMLRGRPGPAWQAAPGNPRRAAWSLGGRSDVRYRVRTYPDADGSHVQRHRACADRAGATTRPDQRIRSRARPDGVVDRNTRLEYRDVRRSRRADPRTLNPRVRGSSPWRRTRDQGSDLEFSSGSEPSSCP